jgi:syntaxin 16
MIEDLNTKFIKLQTLQQKRIMPKFDEEENKKIDRQIKELILKMTQKVKNCENNIKSLNKIYFDSSQNESIKNNIQINLAEKIKNFTHDFRINEEKYMKNYKELVGVDDNDDNKNSYNYIEINTSNNSQNNFLELQIDNTLKQRDEEINTLLTSITELAQTFKDMQTIVQEQGTILDRIDYNIDTTLTNVTGANKHLQKARDRLKKNCFRNCTMTVITIIFIESLLLLFRYT